MLYLLNFGESPFEFLFYLIIAIGAAVLLANGVAWGMSIIVVRQIEKVARRS